MQGLGFRVHGLGFGASGLGFEVYGLGVFQGLGFRGVWGFGMRVVKGWCLGFRAFGYTDPFLGLVLGV